MTDTQNDTSELRQHLYDVFGQNFLDGDKPSEWKATTMNASEVKEFIDEFVVPLIAQREQAAELRGRTQAAKLVGELSHKLVRYGDGAIAYHNGEAQVLVSDVLKVHATLATKPEKEV